MAKSPDIHDLQEYAASGNEAAFRRLVERHSAMVRGVTSRLTRDHALAEEITQSVFILLARKARNVSGDRLSGWLHGAAVGEARNAMRKEVRRSRLHLNYLETMKGKPSAEVSWAEVAPYLDHAVSRLSPEDRELVLLRYFEGRSFPEISVATGRSVEACKKRAQRALDRLGALLGKRGVTIGGSSLASLLATAAVLQPAPASAAAISVLSVHAASSAPAFAPGFLTFLQVMTTKQSIGVVAAIVALAAIPLAVVMNRPDFSVEVISSAPEYPGPPDGAAPAPPDPLATANREPRKDVKAAPINWAELARTKFSSRNHTVREKERDALAKRLTDLSNDELSEGLDKIALLDASRMTKYELFKLVGEELSKRDPMRVLEKLSGPEDNIMILGTNAYEVFEAKDPVAAENWLKEQKAKGNIGNLECAFQSSAVTRLLKSDPAAAIQRLMSLPEEMQAEVLMSATELKFIPAFEATLEHYERTGDDSLVNRFVESGELDQGVINWGESGPEYMKELLGRVPDEKVREKARRRVDAMPDYTREGVPLELLMEGEKR